MAGANEGWSSVLWAAMWGSRLQRLHGRFACDVNAQCGLGGLWLAVASVGVVLTVESRVNAQLAGGWRAVLGALCM